MTKTAAGLEFVNKVPQMNIILVLSVKPLRFSSIQSWAELEHKKILLPVVNHVMQSPYIVSHLS